MSSNIIALQSTNIINCDKNTTSSDLTLTRAYDGRKKRVGLGGKTHKHRSLDSEVAPVVHEAMVSPVVMITHESQTFTKDTKEAPFDAKAILPDSKALKSISKLLESMNKVVRFPDQRSNSLTLTNSLDRGP